MNFDQVLWLYSDNHEVRPGFMLRGWRPSNPMLFICFLPKITECGAMNCFIYLKNENGEDELVTPPLDGLTLPGVTRDSILSLAKEWNEFKVGDACGRYRQGPRYSFTCSGF